MFVLLMALLAKSRWLGTPKLVRETSRRGIWGRSKTASGEKTVEEAKRDFSDIVLPKQLHNHIRALAAVTANTKAHGAPFRHMLFYGPPGMLLLLGCGDTELYLFLSQDLQCHGLGLSWK